MNAAALQGRRGLVTGIANQDSIAWGCARAFRALGAELAVTYLNDKARVHVEPLARSIDAALLLPLDLRVDGQLESVFEQIGARWGSLDFVMHSIAYAPRDVCGDAWSTARAQASCRPWTSRAGRSSAWRTWPSP